MPSDFLSDSKAWFTLNKNQQQRVIDSDFNDSFANGKNPIYNNATQAVKDKLKLAHKQVMEEAAYKSEFNPSNINARAAQENADNSGILANFVTQIKDSHTSLFDRTALLAKITANGGIADADDIKAMARYYEKQNSHIETTQTKELAAALKPGIDQWALPGVKNKLEALRTFVTEAVKNPVGVLDVGAKSSSSMTNMGLGAWGGGKVGAGVGALTSPVTGPAGPVTGAAIGSKVGAGTAATIDATSSKFFELLSARLKEKGLEPTETNLALALNDEAWRNQAFKTSATYGAALGAGELILGKVTTSLGNLSKVNALKTARAGLSEVDDTAIAALAQRSGKTVEATTESFVNNKAATILAAQSFKRKATGKMVAYGGEVISEPVGEFAANVAAGEKNTVENLVYETLGGVGTGPFGAALNTSLHGTKLVTDKAIETGKGVLTSTPETKAAAVERKDAIQAATILSRTEVLHKYDDKIAAIDPDSEEHANLSNPDHPSYNPIIAIDAVIKLNDPAAHSKAQTIANDYTTKALAVSQQFKDLRAKITQEGYKPTKQEVDELEDLHKLGGITMGIANKLWKRVDTIQTNIANQAAPASPIDFTKDAPEDIIVKLGSHGTRRTKEAPTVADITTALQQPDINPIVKKALIVHKDALVARQSIEEIQAKSLDGVSTDIYNGARGSYFKGIDAYQQGIKHFLDPRVNNVAKAQTELDGLRKFSEAHTLKADMVTKAYEAMTNPKKKDQLTPEVQQYLTDNNIEIHPVLSKNYVPTIQKEAAALQKEVKLAEATFKALSPKTNTTLSTAPKSTAINAPAKPVVAPVTPAPVAKPKLDNLSKLSFPELQSMHTDAETAIRATTDINTNLQHRDVQKAVVAELAKRGFDIRGNKLNTKPAAPVVVTPLATKPVVESKPPKSEQQTTTIKPTGVAKSIRSRWLKAEAALKSKDHVDVTPEGLQDLLDIHKEMAKLPDTLPVKVSLKKLGAEYRAALNAKVTPVVKPAPVVTPAKPVPTGQVRLTELAKEYRAGTVTVEGHKELQDIYRAARTNKDSQEHMDKIAIFGKTYKRALDKLAPVVEEVLTPKPEAVPAAPANSKPIGEPSKFTKVTLKHKNEDDSTTETVGKEFTVDGLDNHKFIVVQVGDKKWIVREQTTNLAISGAYAKTQKAAMQQAMTNLKKAGQQGVASAVAKAPKKIITETASEPVTESVETIEPVTEEIPVDKFADYDIDYSTLQINMGTEDNPIMMTYAEAIAQNEQQLKEADKIMECIKSK